MGEAGDAVAPAAPMETTVESGEGNGDGSSLINTSDEAQGGEQDAVDVDSPMSQAHREQIEATQAELFANQALLESPRSQRKQLKDKVEELESKSAQHRQQALVEQKAAALHELNAEDRARALMAMPKDERSAVLTEMPDEDRQQAMKARKKVEAEAKHNTGPNVTKGQPLANTEEVHPSQPRKSKSAATKTEVSDHQLKLIADVFHSVDFDNNGYVTVGELRQGARQERIYSGLGLDDASENLKQTMKSFHHDDDSGKLDADEFKELCVMLMEAAAKKADGHLVLEKNKKETKTTTTTKESNEEAVDEAEAEASTPPPPEAEAKVDKCPEVEVDKLAVADVQSKKSYKGSFIKAARSLKSAPVILQQQPSIVAPEPASTESAVQSEATMNLARHEQEQVLKDVREELVKSRKSSVSVAIDQPEPVAKKDDMARYFGFSGEIRVKGDQELIELAHRMEVADLETKIAELEVRSVAADAVTAEALSRFKEMESKHQEMEARYKQARGLGDDIQSMVHGVTVMKKAKDSTEARMAEVTEKWADASKAHKLAKEAKDALEMNLRAIEADLSVSRLQTIAETRAKLKVVEELAMYKGERGGFDGKMAALQSELYRTRFMAKEEFKKEALQEMRQEIKEAKREKDAAVRELRRELNDAKDENELLATEIEEAQDRIEDMAAQLSEKARRHENTVLGKTEMKLKGTEEALSRLRFKYAILLHKNNGESANNDGELEPHRIPRMGGGLLEIEMADLRREQAKLMTNAATDSRIAQAEACEVQAHAKQAQAEAKLEVSEAKFAQMTSHVMSLEPRMNAVMKQIASEREARQAAEREVVSERQAKASLQEGLEARELLLESSTATIKLQKERVEQLETEIAMLRRDNTDAGRQSDWGKTLNAKLAELDGKIAAVEGRLNIEAMESGWSDHVLEAKLAEATAQIRNDALSSEMATASKWSKVIADTKAGAVRERLRQEASTQGWSDRTLSENMIQAELLIEEEAIGEAASKASEWSQKLLTAKMVVIEDMLITQGKAEGWDQQTLAERIAAAELDVIQEGVAAEEKKAVGWGCKLFDAKITLEEKRLHQRATEQKWTAHELGRRIAESETHMREEEAIVAAEARVGCNWMSNPSSRAPTNFILQHGFARSHALPPPGWAGE